MRSLRLTLLALLAITGACTPAPVTTQAEDLPAATSPAATSARSSPSPSPTPSPTAAPVTLVGAGDIASCISRFDEATAVLLDEIPGTVFTLGDNVYDIGSPQEFAQCYASSWGRHRARTRPAPGNHDYGVARASGYFGYFGELAGPADRGYYSYDAGTWHVIVLNSNCYAVGGCDEGSAQERWLRADLAAHPARCTLAYWHHPLFSSGLHGPMPFVRPLWQALYDGGADVVLAGHDHHYERFAPLDADGRRDDERGIRSFIVGTGGRSLYPVGYRLTTSEAIDTSTYGVLKLTLRAGGYDWSFIPAASGTFTDSGSGRCH